MIFTIYELFAKACKADYWTSGTDAQQEYWPKDTSNWENTYRFQFARKVNETNATYSFKIINVSTGTEVRSGSWTSSYVNGTINTWKEPILMHWKNKGSGGHYSNIAWSSSYDL